MQQGRQGAGAALLLEATGTWLPLVESYMKFGLALPPNILSTVLQYLMQALTQVLHFSSCLKIPSQTAFMGNFWPLFAFGSFGTIGQTYWMAKKSCEFLENLEDTLGTKIQAFCCIVCWKPRSNLV